MTRAVFLSSRLDVCCVPRQAQASCLAPGQGPWSGAGTDKVAGIGVGCGAGKGAGKEIGV